MTYENIITGREFRKISWAGADVPSRPDARRATELKLDARTNHLWQRGYNWKFVPPQAEAAVRQYIQTQMDRLEKFAR